jgi:hypothetical protein
MNIKKATMLRKQMESLKSNGIPIYCTTNVERVQAHNIANALEIEIATRRRIGIKGYEIFRTR